MSRTIPWTLLAAVVLLLIICSKLETLNDSVTNVNNQVYNVKVATERVVDSVDLINR